MTTPAPEAPKEKSSSAGHEIVLLLKSLLPAVILIGAAFLFLYILSTAPTAEKAKRTHRAHLVSVVDANPGSHLIRVPARGVVEAAREVTLNPQVAGEVIMVSDSLIPGGFFNAGEAIVSIDPTDYELAQDMRRAEVTQMEARQALEKANRNVAQREYEVLGQDLKDEEKALVLREPQLASAEAEVASARAMLNDAQLDLKRTKVTAPFNAQVVEKMVDLGTRLTTQMSIVRLVGTETYWVVLSVAQSDLRWVVLPSGDEVGSRVELTLPKVWGKGRSREGRVIRLLPSMSAEGRMAQVLVAVDDPLCLKPENEDKPKLLVGQYLVASIEGKTLENVVAVDRSMLRNGDVVWVMNAENKLEIRPITVSYRGPDDVVVEDGLSHGDRIISSGIGTVAEGMALRTGSDDDKPAESEKGAAATGEGA